MNINSASILLLFGTFMFSACNVSINTKPLVSPRFNAHPYSVVIQSDGKIVLAGWMETASGDVIRIVRYKIDGLLDTSFNATGKVTTTIGLSARGESAAIQSDGKIVVAGWMDTATGSDFAVLRYGIDGILDASFNNSGIVTTAIGTFSFANSVAIQSDGKIVVAGYSDTSTGDVFAAVRYYIDGSLDTSFNNTGKVTTAKSLSSRASSLAIQSDRKITVAEYTNTSMK